MIKRIALLLFVIIVIGSFFLFDLQHYLSLAFVQSLQVGFQEHLARNQLAVTGAYVLIYILVTALSLPGAVVLTIAGGAFFGLFFGTLIVSFCSTIGASAACLASRFVLRNWVQQKFGDRLVAINHGIEKEGAFYLFSLRLIPVFPFFIINLLMGLTKMPIRTYFWVSQLGMLPATVVYVNAGKEIGKIDSVAAIASPALIASFIMLGLLPLMAKQLIKWYRKNRQQEQENGKI